MEYIVGHHQRENHYACNEEQDDCFMNPGRHAGYGCYGIRRGYECICLDCNCLELSQSDFDLSGVS